MSSTVLVWICGGLVDGQLAARASQLADQAAAVSPAAFALPGEHPMADQVRDFLAGQEFAGKAANTIRAYRGDLLQFAQHTDRDVAGVDADVLASWSRSIVGLQQSTRARKQAAVTCFLRWAVRHDLATSNPMDDFDRLAVPKGIPRPVDPARINRIIARAWPLRDELLFEFLKILGCQVSEALRVDVEDLDLTPGRESVLIHGKGGRDRLLALEDEILCSRLRRFLRVRGYTHGPLFRAGRNWNGKPLTYSTVQELWARYRALANDPGLELNQLRHTRATELLKAGVSIRTIQAYFGHRKLQTTMVYVEHTDVAAGAETRGHRAG